jgi:hypothetical protein
MEREVHPNGCGGATSKTGGRGAYEGQHACEYVNLRAVKYVIKLKITRVKTSIKAPTLGFTLFLLDFLNLWCT